MSKRSDRPVRIAFLNLCKRDWIAGCHYLKNLFSALKTLPTPPQIVLLKMDDDDTVEMLMDDVDEVIVYPPKRPFAHRLRYAVQYRTGLDFGTKNPLQYLLEQAGIDVLFASKSGGPHFDFPTLVWIADFQHLHLPYMFTDEDRLQRDRHYREWIASATRIIVSSQQAKQDMEGVLPQHAHKSHVLNFVSKLPAEVYDGDPSWVCAEYHLPRQFFYLPNQFWQHKNHTVVVDALALIRETHPDVTVVCSGNIYDYRNPTYFGELLLKIAKCGVHQQFIILGMIPHNHIFALMRQSTCVLQPSKFEGWSTTVEETKSLGKRIILSDIPVHREQNPPHAIYFALDDPQSLAQAIIKIWEDGLIGPDTALEQQARASFAQRQQAFASTFMKIVNEVVTSSSK
jgi:glycosyltransferase involved in cell wall biosynthesis